MPWTPPSRLTTLTQPRRKGQVSGFFCVEEFTFNILTQARGLPCSEGDECRRKFRLTNASPTCVGSEARLQPSQQSSGNRRFLAANQVPGNYPNKKKKKECSMSFIRQPIREPLQEKVSWKPVLTKESGQGQASMGLEGIEETKWWLAPRRTRFGKYKSW